MGFYKFLKTTSLKKDSINDIRFFHDYLIGKHDPRLSSKIVILMGEAGVGKTYLAKRFVKSLDLPVLYVGQEPIKGKHIKTYSSVKNLTKIKFPDNCLIFLDDLNYLSEENQYGEMTNDYKRHVLKLLAIIKSLPRAGLLITTNYLDFDSQFDDRMDIVIVMEEPNRKTKRKYIKNQYGKFLDIHKINILTNKQKNIPNITIQANNIKNRPKNFPRIY